MATIAISETASQSLPRLNLLLGLEALFDRGVGMLQPSLVRPQEVALRRRREAVHLDFEADLRVHRLIQLEQRIAHLDAASAGLEHHPLGRAGERGELGHAAHQIDAGDRPGGWILRPAGR